MNYGASSLLKILKLVNLQNAHEYECGMTHEISDHMLQHDIIQCYPQFYHLAFQIYASATQEYFLSKFLLISIFSCTIEIKLLTIKENSSKFFEPCS